MLTINDYLNAALERQNLPSDRQLSLRLSEAATTICQWRSGTKLPRKDETMRRIAELAGMDVEQAMIDLGEWRAERADDHATASVYAAMRRHLQSARQVSAGAAVGCAALAAVTFNPGTPTHANEVETNAKIVSENALYYGK